MTPMNKHGRNESTTSEKGKKKVGEELSGKTNESSMSSTKRNEVVSSGDTTETPMPRTRSKRSRAEEDLSKSVFA